MGDWYWIGMLAGLGAGIGILFAGLAGRSRAGAALAIVLAVAAGLAAGLGIGEWDEAVGGATGGLLGAGGAVLFVWGSLRVGGTAAGTAMLLAAVALVTGALALIPGLGYLEALAVPALAARLRNRAPERYAGLRTLAR